MRTYSNQYTISSMICIVYRYTINLESGKYTRSYNLNNYDLIIIQYMSRGKHYLVWSNVFSKFYENIKYMKFDFGDNYVKIITYFQFQKAMKSEYCTCMYLKGSHFRWVQAFHDQTKYAIAMKSIRCNINNISKEVSSRMNSFDHLNICWSVKSN